MTDLDRKPESYFKKMGLIFEEVKPDVTITHKQAMEWAMMATEIAELKKKNQILEELKCLNSKKEKIADACLVLIDVFVEAWEKEHMYD